jgi:hypothetical protein
MPSGLLIAFRLLEPVPELLCRIHIRKNFIICLFYLAQAEKHFHCKGPNRSLGLALQRVS